MNLILDVARGLAALAVFLFHMPDLIAPAIPALARIAESGSLGVALFFVISGYVITSSAVATAARAGSPNAFLLRRFLRIYPPFWFSIVIVCAMPFVLAAVSSLKSGELTLPEPRYLSLGLRDWVELASLVKVFSATSNDLQALFNQVNSVYWTLAIEFQFYLCVWLGLALRCNMALWLGGVTACSGLALLTPLGQALNPGLFIHYWPMFAIGVGLYYMLKRGFEPSRVFGQHRWLAAAALLGVLAWVLVSAYRLDLMPALAAWGGDPQLAFALLSGVVLWLFASWNTQLQADRVAAWPALVRWLANAAAYLGCISYSVYLLHPAVYALPAMVARQIWPASSAWLPIFTVACTLLICGVFHRVAEKPFMSRAVAATNRS